MNSTMNEPMPTNTIDRQMIATDIRAKELQSSRPTAVLASFTAQSAEDCTLPILTHASTPGTAGHRRNHQKRARLQPEHPDRRGHGKRRQSKTDVPAQ